MLYLLDNFKTGPIITQEELELNASGDSDFDKFYPGVLFIDFKGKNYVKTSEGIQGLNQ